MYLKTKKEINSIKINISNDSISTYYIFENFLSVASVDRIDLNKWWISRVKIHDKHMNKGIGSMLLEKLIESIPSNSDIIVSPGGYLTDKNKQFKFYLKNGFSKTDDENILIYKK